LYNINTECPNIVLGGIQRTCSCNNKTCLSLANSFQWLYWSYSRL